MDQGIKRKKTISSLAAAMFFALAVLFLMPAADAAASEDIVRFSLSAAYTGVRPGQEPSSLAMSQKKLDMKVGEKTRIYPVTEGRELTGAKVSWLCDRSDLLQVIDGNLYAVGCGRARVYAFAGGKKAVATVRIKNPDNATENLCLSKGSSRKIRGKKPALFVVSGNSVELKKGRITGVQEGMSLVRAKFSDGSMRMYRVFVEDDVLTGDARLSGGGRKYTLSLKQGDGFLLHMPALHQLPMWRSSDPAVAYVSEYGVVCAAGEGKARLFARVNKKKISVLVTVEGTATSGSASAHALSGQCSDPDLAGYAPGHTPSAAVGGESVSGDEFYSLYAVDAINGSEGCIIGINDRGDYYREKTAAGSEDVPEDLSREDYGVFLSVTDSFDRMHGYETVVIDAQYFEADRIAEFKKEGHRVYSYINVGSLENFRDYYGRFSDLALGPYENWDEEVWVDVSDSGWQDFICRELAPSLMDKGIDGFFVDNCDVYYNYPKDSIFEGLSVIMKYLAGTGKAVLINSGNDFLDRYSSQNSWKDVITGINQETVFSKILWGKNGFGAQDAGERKFFMEYIEKYGDQGADIYLLEYTRDQQLIAEIAEYCRRKGYKYYISDSIELD